MQNHGRYHEAVRCLAVYGYEVIPDGPGYIVQRCDNCKDVSRARDLDDLVDIAELFEWAAQHTGRYASPRTDWQVVEPADGGTK